ncbi:UNVERIFIED_CONTAM: hypothetical protein RMT77_017708 [Armadillidium vulgare]
MFTKQGEQKLWIKIKITRGKIAQKCYHGLPEACGNSALPYRTFARWIKAFRVGWNEIANLPSTFHQSIPDHQIKMVRAILATYRQWTTRELSVEVRFGHQTV